MIFHVCRTHWTKFRRDRAGFILTFIVPIAFFSVFALLFGGKSTGSSIRLGVVNEDSSPAASTFLKAMHGEKALNVLDLALDNDGRRSLPMTAARAEHEIRTGDLGLAIVIPKGFRASVRPHVVMLADTSDPFSSRIASSVLQKIVLGGSMPLDVQTQDVLGASKQNPRIAFAAAGLGVMFLLFMASAAGGALIDEAESGTLDRILSTRVSMTQLLFGKLLYLVSLSSLQLTLTFIWGALIFGVELWKHLGGFLIMTIITSIATSSFGLMLAASCKTRAQLGAVSNLVVLVMSALGGSMFPRFLMPAALKKFSLITLNAWALDGFLKVFWREEPLINLWPQITALLLFATALFTIARLLARRWETQ